MRTSAVVTISLPPAMAKMAQKIAKRQQMTHSELIRTALRSYLAELQTREAVRVYKKEKRAGKLKILKGSLIDFM